MAAAGLHHDRITSLATADVVADTDDLEVFADIVGDASVWSFGEATHGAHEFLALRNRLFRFAVERLGFTAIALETHHGDVAAADDYVLGRAALGVDTVQAMFSANAAFGWTPHPFRENLELLRWMRHHNAHSQTRRPIRVYGLDAGWSSAAPPEWDGSVELSAALDLVSSMDPRTGVQLEALVAPFLTRFNSEQVGTLTGGERLALRQGLASIVTTFEAWAVLWIERASELEFSRALRHAQIASLLAPDPATPMDPPPRTDAPRGERDLVMADSVRWVLEREGRQGRVFVFASNGHVHRGPCSYPDPTWRDYPSMGQQLHASLGEAMVVVGSAFDRGRHTGVHGSTPEVRSADAGSVSGELARMGPPLFVADLRSTRSKMAPMRSATDHDDPRLRASDSFDAVVFVDHVSPIRPMDLDEVRDLGAVPARMDGSNEEWAMGPAARGWRRPLHGDRCLRSV